MNYIFTKERVLKKEQVLQQSCLLQSKMILIRLITNFLLVHSDVVGRQRVYL